MHACFKIILILFISTVFCFSQKKMDSLSFQFGKVIEPLSSITLKTSEIASYMPSKKMLFVVGDVNVLEVIDFSNPINPKKINEIELPSKASSVTIYKNIIALSLLNDSNEKLGHVQIMKFSDSLELFGVHELCYTPDMITFSPDGKNLLIACEGSPDLEYSVDPMGGIGILSISNNLDLNLWKSPEKKVIGFENLDSNALMSLGIRKTGVQSFVQSLEPEYITISEDSKIAWVSLQENNALLKFDIQSKKIVDIFPLGYVDHSKKGFGLDVINDKKINIANYPLRGLRQPDGISFFSSFGKNYIVTANEGAPVNDYKAWTDVTSPMMLLQQGKLDENIFDTKLLNELKNLSVSNLEDCSKKRDVTSNGKCPYMYTFGTRSISIFDGDSGKFIWDSGDELEQVIAKIAPNYFNWNAKKKKIKMDSRSEDKGPEPENVTIGVVNNKRYAFVGLERTSGIAVFDITNVGKKGFKPKLVDFFLDINHRGPEGILFIPSEKSPILNQALLVVLYEYSKTLSVYKVK